MTKLTTVNNQQEVSLSLSVAVAKESVDGTNSKQPADDEPDAAKNNNLTETETVSTDSAVSLSLEQQDEDAATTLISTGDLSDAKDSQPQTVTPLSVLSFEEQNYAPDLQKRSSVEISMESNGNNKQEMSSANDNDSEIAVPSSMESVDDVNGTNCKKETSSLENEVVASNLQFSNDAFDMDAMQNESPAAYVRAGVVDAVDSKTSIQPKELLAENKDNASSETTPTPTLRHSNAPQPHQSLRKPRSVNNDKNKSRRRSTIVSLARTVLNLTRLLVLDLPLALTLASFIGLCLVRRVHNEFYVPLMNRATRTDAQLQQEFTYYERQCTEYDISTDNINDMLLTVNTTTHPPAMVVSTAVQQMLQHGATILPMVLQPDTVQALREYVVRRNAAVSAEEQYPMSQGERRLSYGVDASEDGAVAAAIAQVAHHPIVRPLLAKLLGDDDPASAEITVITAYAGAEDQVWHQDTKQDGNAIKFARTYSHSYSLFLPLQNTTGLMGATDLVPGTHMCANDIEPMCDRNKLGLHLVGASADEEEDDNDNDHGFPAGYGALLNQHVWHRGGAHTDPSAPERIVLVLSFLARPRFDKDPRQLSRGTYFHQKWIMWGHTWKDLLNPMVRMRRPFSILRCLSLWKPPDSNWGYDLITSGFMRFSNEQLEYEDFETRFLPRLDQWHFPEFLRGRHIRDAPQKITWTVFIRETLDNLYVFLGRVTLLAHGVYSVILFLVALGLALWRPMSRTWVRLVRDAAFRLAITHGFVIVVAFVLWQHICRSKWGRSVSSGTALMRPFPSPDRNISITERSIMLEGPTTLPTRNDVLSGTRYDADFLGSYNLWLDYHPGNAMLKELTKPHAAAYTSYRTTVLKRAVVHYIMDQIQKNDGRFLGQDYLSGDWVVMNARETEETVAAALLASSSEKLASVLTKLHRMIADHRFGPRRDQAMAKLSQIMLWHLRQSMIRIESPVQTRLDKYVAHILPASLQSRPPDVPTGIALFAPISRATDVSAMRSLRPYHRSRGWSSPSGLESLRDSSDDWRVGSLVWCAFEDLASSWFPGTITEVDGSSEWFSVAFEDGSREDGLHRSRLRKFTPVQENDRVEGCFAEEGLQDCYSGTVARVWPSGFVAIFYDDGEYDPAVHPTKYFVPPYRYEGPFPY